MKTKPKIVFSDFDGTLTQDDSVGPLFFEILELLKKNSIPLVIVSGRGLSWGHFLVSHFPVRAAIMEGGGVIVTKRPNGQLEETLLVSEEDIEHLATSAQELSRLVPLTVDSHGRKCDRAIELEDYHAHQAQIEAFLSDKNLQYSCSNIHLNFWVGVVSKAKAAEVFLKEHYPEVKKEECLFFGDAPNDQSMFQTFPWCVAVSNIANFKDEIQHYPKTILEGDDNAEIKGVYNYLKDLIV